MDNWEGIYRQIVNNDENWLQIKILASPLEVKVASDKRNSIIATHRTSIIKGMYALHKKACSDLLYAERQMETAQQGEINEWDVEKLNAEITLANSRVNNAIHADNPKDTIGERLYSLVSEADQSKDKNKQRAISEAIQSVNVKGLSLDDRKIISRIASEQREQSIPLRTNESMTKAQTYYNNSFNNLDVVQHRINQISKTINEGDGFRVHATNDASKMFRKFADRNIEGDRAVKTVDDVVKFYHG